MSKLQETTMTTPEQLKEEFYIEFSIHVHRNEETGELKEFGLDQDMADLDVIADFWLNKIQSLLGEIEGRIEGERKTLPVRSNENRGTIDEIREINKVMGRNEALDKALSIIQEYKGK